MDYSVVRDAIEDILDNRIGFADSKLFNITARELTGLFLGFAHEHNESETLLLEFLSMVKTHKITNIDTGGDLKDVSDLIDDNITSNPFYEMTEFALMHYRPGKVQAGPGEFFLCFYDEGAEFGVDNHIGYDIKVAECRLELKKLGSNFTTPDIFDKYAESGDVDNLLVVKPVSDAKKPKFRSKFISIDVNRWRDAFIHVEQSDGLLNLRFK